MASAVTLAKVKTDLRISHMELDGDIRDTIDAGLADLAICGVTNAGEDDPAILSALKLYCRAAYTDDTDKAAAYLIRYNAMKGTLMMATGYGGDDNE